jgi:hypothetical protein
MDGKSFLLSTTLWFNLVAGIVLFVNAFGYADFVPIKELDEYVAVVITIVNIVLRFRTTEPIAIKKP